MTSKKALQSVLSGCLLAVCWYCISGKAQPQTPVTSSLADGGKVGAGASPALIQESAVTLHYAVFVHGFHVMDADGSYVLRPWGYGGQAHLKTVGLASWFTKIDISSRVEGRFEGGRAHPIDYESVGLSRKKQRRAHITFDQKGPHIVLLEPKDDDREPLPSATLESSIDILSGLAILFQSLSTTGKCNISGTLFDGLRLTYITTHGPFVDKAPDIHNSYYAGQEARRCDFEGYQIAGFVKNSRHKKLLSTPQPGKAWFLTLPHYGIVPVEIKFHHPKIGDVEMIMQSAPHKADIKKSTSKVSEKTLSNSAAEQ